MRFAAAYEQSRDAVYGYLVYMTRDVPLAEDLSQEVFLRMFLHLDKKSILNITSMPKRSGRFFWKNRNGSRSPT